MDTPDFNKLAQQYTAKSEFFNAYRFAGEENGARYYHIYAAHLIGHKLGLPHIIKIDKRGKVQQVTDFEERMRASAREVDLNNL